MTAPQYQTESINSASTQAVLASLKPLAGDRCAALIRATIILMMATGFGLIGPLLLGTIIDYVSTQQADSVLLLLSGFVGTIILSAVLTWWGKVLIAQEGELILERLRNRLLGHALSISLDRLERAGTGDLVSRLTGDINTLASVIRFALPLCALAVIELALLLIALLLISPSFILAVSIGLLPVWFGGRWYLKHAPPRYDEERRRIGQLTEILQEQLAGWSTLRSLNHFSTARSTIDHQADRIYDANMSTTRARNILRPAVILGQSLSMLLTLGLGVVLFHRDSLTLGLLTAAALYQLRLIDPISTLLELLDNLQSASAAYRRVLGVEPLANATSTIASNPADTTLSLNNLGFRYAPNQAWVLRHLSLTISPGEHLAIVGPSGAGKTTLGKLLAGIHSATEGQIRLGDVSYADIHSQLPNTLTLLTQETHLFAGTLAEDLRLAAPEATDEELHRCLEQAGARPWVQSLPKGIQTLVGAGYRSLTPAQEQQLALTRLLLKDPAIVILDEAMANLSPTLSGTMERRLDKVLSGRTVISITHRLDSARRADRIAVIEEGLLRQLGDHDTLLGQEGPYQRLWRQHEGQSSSRVHI